MDSPTGTPGIFSQAWALTRKSLVPSLVVMALLTGLRLLFSYFVFPENFTLPSSAEEISTGFLGKLLAGFGLVLLLSFLVYLFIVSLTASRLENRPWNWSMGFQMALEKVFAFTMAVILVFLQILALALLLSLALGLASGGKMEWLSLILGIQMVGIFITSFIFLVNYILLPQVLLLEKLPFLLALRRSAYLVKGRKLDILRFLATCYGPLILIQGYVMGSEILSAAGLGVPPSQGLTLGLTILTEAAALFIMPFLLAGTTVFYYKFKSREVNIVA